MQIDSIPTIRIGQPSSIKDRVFTEVMTAQFITAQDFEAGDNALVQVANFDTSGAALPVASQVPAVREAVVYVGYPGDTASITEMNQQDPTFKDGRISAISISKKGVPQLQIDGEIIGGMSGGPTLNEAGQVVGVNSATFPTVSTSYVTHTDALRAVLKQWSVPFVEGGSPEVKGSNAPVPAPAPQAATEPFYSTPLGVLVIVASLIALVAIVLLIVVFSRRKPKQSVLQSQQGWQPNQPWQPPQGRGNPY